MGFNELIGKLFGNKNTRDMREIQPWVEKAKKAYIAIEMLTADELRAKTKPCAACSTRRAACC